MKTIIATTKGLSQHYIRTMCNSKLAAAMPPTGTMPDSHIPQRGLHAIASFGQGGGGGCELLGTLLPKQKDTVITDSTN